LNRGCGIRGETTSPLLTREMSLPEGGMDNCDRNKEKRQKRPGLIIKKVPWNSLELKARQDGRKRGEENSVENALRRKVL